MSDAIVITSRLDASQRRALEELLFFNAQQDSLRGRLEEVIERFGVPQVVLRDGQLRIEIDRLPGVQSLFAVSDAGAPIGCAIFHRASPECFMVLHLVVEPAFSSRGSKGHSLVLMRLLGAIREAGRRTRGVRGIELLYVGGRRRVLPISPH